MITKQTLGIAEIRQLYPNQWVLLANPEFLGATVLRGIVLAYSQDKREIAYSGVDWRASFESATTIFTGEMPKNRKFWL
jgi:hypothetical protein